MAVHHIKKYFAGLLSNRGTDPKDAYNLWANCYDNQPGNLILDLDEEIVSGMLEEINLGGKTVADIGCGTGRHWPKIISKGPSRLVGYDVSEGMLKKLQQKFPYPETYLLKGTDLPNLEDNSCALVFSTLTIAHIKDIPASLKEWNRVLKANGEMIITDYHPVALQNGSKRTFRHNNKTIAVRNFIHSIDEIRRIAGQLSLVEIRFTERMIDEAIKEYYEAQNALHLYEKFKGTPVIYGIHFKKRT
jgi:ubiquinone/menaquinone biosynthesis C-methylase UbiE